MGLAEALWRVAFIASAAAAGILVLLSVLRMIRGSMHRINRRLVDDAKRRSGRMGPRLAGSPCPACGEGALFVVEDDPAGRAYLCSAGCGYRRGIGGPRPGRRP